MRKKISAFTLVELAIVMTIIGLLIGGTLKGQELLQNARITTTIAQIKSYQAALLTFNDTYNAMPGDMSNASSRIPGCTIACNMDPAAVATGGAFGKPDDGFIGSIPWQMWSSQGILLTPNAAQSGPGNEAQMFWVILLKANLISGVTDVALSTSTPMAWGVTHPAAKTGGGFLVGQGNNQRLAGQPAGSTGLNGLFIGIASVPQAPAAPPIAGIAVTTVGGNVLTPGRAAQMDRKMDDGAANTGSVQAFGPEGTSESTGCFWTIIGRALYSEANSSTDCGIATLLKN